LFVPVVVTSARGVKVGVHKLPYAQCAYMGTSHRPKPVAYLIYRSINEVPGFWDIKL